MSDYLRKNPEVQLIHVTSSIDNLKSILCGQSFRLKYCKEEFCIPGKEISRRVHPMVCFTEQNIKQLGSTNITYGKYGIAMSADWVEKNGIQPVMYIEQNSQIANSIATLLTYRRKLKRGHLLRLPIINIACFTKNASGHNSYLNEDNFLFKHENEWRYVPTKKEIGNGYISESRNVFNKDQEKYNRKLEKYPLHFDIKKDVMSVFCDNALEINGILNISSSLKGKVKTAPWSSNVGAL